MKAVNQEKSSKKLAAIKSVEFNQKLNSQSHISIWKSFIYEPWTMQKATQIPDTSCDPEQ